MQRTLYSVRLSIADIIFRSQLTLPSTTDPSIAHAPNNMPCKTFLERKLYKFHSGQCFTISFNFSSIFIILFLSQFNGLFRSIKMKNCGYFQSVFNCMIDVFSSYKDVNAQWYKVRDGYNYGDFCSTWTTTSSLQCKLVLTTETASLSNSLVGSFTHYKHSLTSGFQINI